MDFAPTRTGTGTQLRARGHGARPSPDPETGYVIDLGELKKILHRAVVDKCEPSQPQRSSGLFCAASIHRRRIWSSRSGTKSSRTSNAGKLHRVPAFMRRPRNFAEYLGPDVI